MLMFFSKFDQISSGWSDSHHGQARLPLMSGFKGIGSQFETT